MAKQVDDMNVAGWREEIRNLRYHLEQAFGPLNFQEKSYTCVGIHFEQLENGTDQLDQNDYIASMNAVMHPELTGPPPDKKATLTVQALYQSLLGDVAHALIIQFWISVYVVALQRRSKSCQNIHVRRRNAVLQALQRSRVSLIYKAMACSKTVVAHPDS